MTGPFKRFNLKDLQFTSQIKTRELDLSAVVMQRSLPTTAMPESELWKLNHVKFGADKKVVGRNAAPQKLKALHKITCLNLARLF